MKNLLLFLSAFLFLNSVNAQSIQLLTHNGGESLTGCTDATVSWKKQGNQSPYVNLYYSVDGGLNWRSALSGYFSPNESGSATWSVPTVNSNTVKIKIQDAYNAAIKDSSDLNLTISSDLSTTGLTVTSPNGGESLSPATIQPISWTSKGAIGNISIVYSVDGGKIWNPVSNQAVSATNIANTGTFNWLVPTDANVVSSKVLIRVYETNKPCNTDFSDAFFSINNTPGIFITGPANNETCYVGRYRTISWRSFNIPGDKVKIDYSVDNGNTWIVEYDSTASNTFGMSWLVPDLVTNQGLMRVSSSRNNAIQHVVSFKIVKPTLSLNHPNGGEVLSGCNKVYVSWTQIGIADTVSVDYSVDGGQNWNNNVAKKISNKNGADSVALSIPNVKTNTARFRIHENANQLVPLKDSSDANVIITADTSKSITLLFPNGGEIIPVNSVQKVTWTSKGGVGNVNIQYSTDNGASWLWMYSYIGESSQNIPNTGFFNWEVHFFIPTTAKVKIRIYETANPCIIDWTDNVFGLHNDPHVSIVKPLDGDSLFANGPYDIGIHWLSTNVFNVDIDYSLDNGVTWNLLFDSIYSSNNGNNARPWTVPNTLTDKGILRIRSATTPSIENKIPFKIVNPILRLIAPTGGESFTSCTDINIKWFQKATSSNATLEYSVDEGANWLAINTLTNPLNGVYNYTWKVPNINTSKLRFRVSDPMNAKVADSSKNNATIVADASIGITLTSPNGGEFLIPTTTHKVTWTNKSIVQYVTIKYSTNAGKTWKTMFNAAGDSASSLGNTGSFDWMISNDAAFANKCLIRINDFYNPCNVDYSDAFFTIDNTPRITILQPKAKDTLYNNISCYFIKWSHYNIPGDKVSIDYSLDNGVNWHVVADSTPSAFIGNIFQWKTPNVTTTQGKLRISATKDKSIKSEVDFKIDTVFLTLLYPLGGEIINNCSASKVVWQNHGKPEVVSVDFSLDEGKSWTRTHTYLGTVGKDSINWTPPNLSSTTARIRIVGECNPLIGDSTKTNFTINKDPQLGLRLIAPNGGESYSVNTFHTVTWETKGNIHHVNVQYSPDGGLSWGYLANSRTGLTSENIPNTGSFIWQVPGGLTPASANVKIKICDANNKCLEDFTDSVFSIDRNPSITILKPEENDTLLLGKPYNIEWSIFAFPYDYHAFLYLEYSFDNGTTWTLLEDSTYSKPDAGLNSLQWTVPYTSANQGILRMYSKRNKATAEVHFKIIPPAVKLVNPTGNEIWYQGESNTISWNVKGLDGNSPLNIHYSIDSAKTWHLIQSVNSVPSSYSWTVPDTVSSQCYIKISSPQFPLCKDSNKVAFEIIKKFKIIAPEAGETWHIGDSRSIKWNSDRSRGPGNVRIEYSLNNGTTWNDIIASVPNSGSYSWTLSPSLSPSKNCLIRVKGLPPSKVYNISDPFEISGSVITDVLSIETDGAWTAYPNPAKDVLKISSNDVINGTVHLRLINAQGQLLFEQNDHAVNGVYTKVIHLTEEKAGIYILQITTDKQSINRKITKQ